MQVSGKFKGTLILLILVASMPYFFVNGKSVVEEEISIDAGPKNWTVLVYMCGDNNLEYFALEDLNEMEAAGGTTAEVNIVSMVDRCAYDYESDYGGTNDWSESRYYTIVGDSLPYSFTSPMNVSLGEKNMGLSQTLDDFISWGLSNYPADKTALILWDHGGGLDGVCWDEDNGDDNLLVDELDIALEGYHFDVIGIDACVMGQFEVLYELKDHCDFYVASMLNEPAYGWDYLSTLGSLIATPSMDAEDFARNACEDYLSYYLGIGYSDPVALSAYNTTAMAGFETLLDDFATELQDALTTNAVDVYDVRMETNSQLFPDIMCDMKEFVDNIALLSIPSLSSAASSLSTKLDDILYVSESSYVTDPYGMWIYLPALPYEYHNDIYIYSNQTDVGGLLNHYYDFEFVENTLWDNFLYSWKTALETVLPTVSTATPYGSTATSGDLIYIYADLPDPGVGYAYKASLYFDAILDYDLYAWSEEYYFNLPNGFQEESATYDENPEEILFLLESATRVFFLIHAYSGSGSFALHITAVDYFDDAYEDNDDVYSAAYLEINTLYNLMYADADFFEVELIAGIPIDIYLNFDSVATDLDLYLAMDNAEYTIVADSLNYYSDEHIHYVPLYSGSFFIWVNYWVGSLPAPYTLEITESPISIEYLTVTPPAPEPGEDITISCEIDSYYPIAEVTLLVSYDGGAEQEIAMTFDGTYYAVTITPPDGVEEVEYAVYIEDDHGYTLTSSVRSISITEDSWFIAFPWFMIPLMILGLASVSLYLKRKRT